MTSRPYNIVVTGLVLLLSKVIIRQFKLYAITVNVAFLGSRNDWIPPTGGVRTLSSGDRVITIGIL